MNRNKQTGVGMDKRFPITVFGGRGEQNKGSEISENKKDNKTKTKDNYSKRQQQPKRQPKYT